MAKAKETTPKKGRPAGKAKVASGPDVPLRRSPRKAIQTAKSLGSDVVAATSRVAKKAATKKASPEKISTTSKASAPWPTSKRTPTEKSTSSPAGKGIATPSPKRGRPRKTPATEPAATKAPKNGRVTKGSGGRKKKSHEKILVAAPTADDDWTDSPKKGLGKRSAKIPTRRSPPVKKLLETETEELYGDASARQASLGGIRKSIEVPSSTRESVPRSRSKSPARGPSKSPTGSPSRSVHGTSEREPSAPVAASASRKRSQNPTKKAERTNRVSRSPSQKESKESTRARSRSPTKTTRSKSPGKSTARDVLTSPSVGALPRPLRVEKTRSSKSPSKNPSRSPMRSRQVSPSKAPVDEPRLFVSGRRSKSLVRSPSKEPKGKSRAPASDDFEEGMFMERFVRKDEYGKALRNLEAQAYRCTKIGQPIEASDAAVSGHDWMHAQERGIQRAELEMGLHTIIDNKDHRPKKGSGEDADHSAKLRRSRSGSHEPPVDGVETGESINDRRRQELMELRKLSQALRHRSVSPRRPLKGVSSKRSSVSPTRKSVFPRKETASRTRASTSPVRISSAPTGNSASPIRKSASPRKRTNQAQSPAPLNLRTGEAADHAKPSAPNRGTVRSVTNPEHIPGTNKKNPFFETMPAPEIWHRQMPPYFPFGETPFMQRVMSRQINEDLARGQEESAEAETFLGRVTSAIKSGVHSVGQTIWRGPPLKERPPAWDLPEVTESEVRDVLKDIKGTHRLADTKTSAQKRKASAPVIGSPPKRVRRLSNGYRMSGAL